jgi:glycosyltransferase involved in cell wall biosynthesis
VIATEQDIPPGDPSPRVMFVNTRSALGADVAVHLTIIEHLDPDAVTVFVATNRHSADLQPTLDWIARARRVQTLVLDLGQESTGSATLTRVATALRNLPVLRTVLHLAGVIRRERITVLHTTDRPRDAVVTTLLGMLTGAAVVLHLHVKWTTSIGRPTKWAASRARACIGISKFTCRSMADGGISPERTALIYNATDATRFAPARVPAGTLRTRLGLGPDVPLIGLVGRFTVWKGHLDMITAFARIRAAVPEARLVFVGRGTREDVHEGVSYGDRMRNRISELGLESGVDWVEWMNDAPAVMRDLDILAMPSWEEPFGLVVTEAMAMERPVVGYASGALPEIVTDGVDGLLVPARDTTALADAMITLLRDPARRVAMGTRGRERVVADFSPQRQAKDVAGLYRRIARNEQIPYPVRDSALAGT